MGFQRQTRILGDCMKPAKISGVYICDLNVMAKTAKTRCHILGSEPVLEEFEVQVASRGKVLRITFVRLYFTFLRTIFLCFIDFETWLEEISMSDQMMSARIEEVGHLQSVMICSAGKTVNLGKKIVPKNIDRLMNAGFCNATVLVKLRDIEAPKKDDGFEGAFLSS